LDETTWSCDGKNGYAWGFFTPTVSLYRLRGTRGSVVAKEVFGDGPHIGDETASPCVRATASPGG